jgi:hypothetical protein
MCADNVVGRCRLGHCTCKHGRTAACDCAVALSGAPCGQCGSGVCGVGLRCERLGCVTPPAQSCFPSGTVSFPVTCPAGTECAFTDDLGFYFCGRALFAIAGCVTPCP